MYKKAFSLLEVVFSLTIILVVVSTLSTLIFSVEKSSKNIIADYTIQKNMDSFFTLLESNLNWKINSGVRVFELKNTYSFPSLEKIFKENLLENSKYFGNSLVIRQKFYDEKSKKIITGFATFIFFDKSLYLKTSDYSTASSIFSRSDALEIYKNCEGSFEVENNKIKVFIKNLNGEKSYERLFSY